VRKALVVWLALGVVLACWGLSAAEDEAPTIKGQAGCNHCAFEGQGGCGAAVKVGDTVYALRPSDQASEATRKLIASFKGASKTTPVAIKGVIQDKTIVADEVTKADTKGASGGCGGCGGCK